jgi:hypothetical protein
MESNGNGKILTMENDMTTKIGNGGPEETKEFGVQQAYFSGSQLFAVKGMLYKRLSPHKGCPRRKSVAICKSE